MKTRLSFFLSALAATSLEAAPITWTTATVSNPSDITTTGSLLGAMNVGGPALPPINGVTFGADPGGPGAIPMGSVTAAFNFDDSFDNDFWAGSNPGGSALYNSALDTGRSRDGGSRTGTVTLGGLVIGNSYQVQLWIVDNRTSPYVLGTRVRTVDGVSTTAGGPNIATGTFTADASTQVITIAGTTGDAITPHGPQLNLIQLRETFRPPIVVTSGANDGAGSLRAALATAAATPGPDTISLSGLTVSLLSTLVINDPDGVTVEGSPNGQPVTINDGTNTTFRLFQVDGKSVLHLNRLTLANGGGNTYVAFGGAIITGLESTLTMTRCTLSGNQTSPGGNGAGGTATAGGAIYNWGNTTLTHCTLWGNTARTGGAISNRGGKLTLTHCTFAANQATGTTPGTAGGAVDNFFGGTLTMTGCILTGNTSVTGTGPELNMDSGTLSARSCFLSNGTGSTLVHGTNGNLVGTTAAPLDPRLAPFAANGGPTWTMPPVAGSPVNDATRVTAGLAIDQRGTVRGTTAWNHDFATDHGGAISRGAGFLDAGSFRLTPNSPDQQGTLVLPDLGNLSSFNASFDYRFFSSGTPADGISFCFGPDPGHIVADFGNGMPHVVRFDIYVDGNPQKGVISYSKNGVVTASNNTALDRFTDQSQTVFHPITVSLSAGGLLTVTYKGTKVIDAVATGYTYAPGDRIIFGSRTGGSSAEQRIDNIGVLTQPAGVMDMGAVEAFLITNPVVTNGGDTNQTILPGFASSLTLREAVNFAAPGSTITFSPSIIFGPSGSRTLRLTSPIDIRTNLTIDASAQTREVILSGQGANRHFNVPSGITAALRSLNLTGGSAASGGSIDNKGTLTLTRCSAFGNNATDAGGAFLNSGSLTLIQCTISGNRCSGAFSESDGGAIYNEVGGFLDLTRTTLSDNEANAGFYSIGGGIYNLGDVRLENSLIAYNKTTGAGPRGTDIYNTGRITLVNANIAGADLTGLVNEFGGQLGGFGFQLFGPTPLLAPLDFYGGLTRTHALLPGSYARNAGTQGTLTTDQRGFPFVGLPDLGSYEAGTPGPNYNAFIWEALPVSATPAQHAAAFDFDDDGRTNAEEWGALTNPASASSFFGIASAIRTGGNLVLTFPTVTGRNYTLENNDSLSGTWTDSGLPALAGTGNPLTFTVPAPVGGVPKRFHRVRVGP